MHLTNSAPILPVLFKSPLGQFNIRKLSSSNTPFLTEGARPKDTTDIEKVGGLGYGDLLMSEKFHHLIAKAGYPKGPEAVTKVNEITKAINIERYERHCSRSLIARYDF